MKNYLLLVILLTAIACTKPATVDPLPAGPALHGIFQRSIIEKEGGAQDYFSYETPWDSLSVSAVYKETEGLRLRVGSNKSNSRDMAEIRIPVTMLSSGLVGSYPITPGKAWAAYTYLRSASSYSEISGNATGQVEIKAYDHRQHTIDLGFDFGIDTPYDPRQPLALKPVRILVGGVFQNVPIVAIQ